jgi:hypothetical protein
MIKKFIQFIENKPINEAYDIMSGKNLFKCYLKVLTALGLKDTTRNKDKIPDNFLIYFRTKDIDLNSVKSVMSRYQQFNTFINEINYTENECYLYYGIQSTNLVFEYGIGTDYQIIPIGKFNLTKGILNWITTLDSPSATNLKKEIVGLNINKITLFSKIKNEMKNFSPGISEKKLTPDINGDIITFAYYGIGKWENGKMNVDELNAIKNNLKVFLSKYKWSNNLQISTTSNQFWIYLNIKIK